MTLYDGMIWNSIYMLMILNCCDDSVDLTTTISRIESCLVDNTILLYIKRK